MHQFQFAFNWNSICIAREKKENWNVLSPQNIFRIGMQMLICCIMNVNRDVWRVLLFHPQSMQHPELFSKHKYRALHENGKSMWSAFPIVVFPSPFEHYSQFILHARCSSYSTCIFNDAPDFRFLEISSTLLHNNCINSTLSQHSSCAIFSTREFAF